MHEKNNITKKVIILKSIETILNFNIVLTAARKSNQNNGTRFCSGMDDGHGMLLESKPTLLPSHGHGHYGTQTSSTRIQ